MSTWRVINSDVRDGLASLPAGSARCCVTSPPYWGLRDYGVSGQLGLESTPEAYVAAMVDVFREVRRVLADDGTLWLNLGDSYAANRGYQVPDSKHVDVGNSRGMKAKDFGLKEKDLVGIPWMVAKALRDPYYTGSIKNEMDRLWLAAMIDTEGSICIDLLRAGAERKNDSYAANIRVHNTSEAIIRKCAEIAGCGTVRVQDKRRQHVYVWAVYGQNAKSIMREVYPYLVAKQQQARLGYGRVDAAGYAALRLLHAGCGTDIDAPAPPDCLEPGWYLRSDIIWSKPNPMPESVTDRPTKAHEYIFLLSKSRSYYYDAAAIREPYAASTLTQFNKPYEGQATKDYAAVGVQNPSAIKKRITDKQRGHGRKHAGFNDRWDGMERDEQIAGGANKRSVWQVATSPYPDAHFATFPEALIEPCILAGSALGDTVLDPFTGSGTTGAVAIRHQRSFVGTELNPAYVELARKRIGAVAPLLAQEVA